MKQCDKGHFFDEKRFQDCPYCSQISKTPRAVATPVVPPVSMEIPKPACGETVAIDMEPVNVKCGHTVAVYVEEQPSNIHKTVALDHDPDNLPEASAVDESLPVDATSNVPDDTNAGDLSIKNDSMIASEVTESVVADGIVADVAVPVVAEGIAAVAAPAAAEGIAAVMDAPVLAEAGDAIKQTEPCIELMGEEPCNTADDSFEETSHEPLDETATANEEQKDEAFGDVNTAALIQSIISTPPKKSVRYRAQLEIHAFVIAIDGPMIGASYACYNEKTRIGRGKENEISLNRDGIVEEMPCAFITYDRFECKYSITPTDAGTVIRLNEEPIYEETALSLYDRISLGDTDLMFIPVCGEKFRW